MPDRTCSVYGCQRPVSARGWCNAHYMRWYQRGSTDGPLPQPAPKVKICSVDGCGGLVVARGWCRLHYGRWHKHGTVADPVIQSVRSCSVAGCERPAIARTLCGTHYARWSKHGTVHPPGSNPPEGMKWCRKCLTYRPIGDFYRENRPVSSPCNQCLAMLKNAYSRRRRAIKRGVASEPYTSEEIADRDGWICQRCRKRIGRRYMWPDPRMLSVDHIVPFSCGGDDTKANVQATHLGCNMSKNRWGTDQLRLMG